MDARLDFNSSEILQKFVKQLNSAAAAVPQGTLPVATVNLVLTRASQINGCAVCVDMHTKDAEHAGETSVRLNLVAAWRDAKVFTDAERAALEVTEQGTRIADAAGGRVLVDHLHRVHPVHVIGSTDRYEVGPVLIDHAQRLVDRIRRAGLPVRAQPVLRRHRRHVLAQQTAQPPGAQGPGPATVRGHSPDAWRELGRCGPAGLMPRTAKR